MMTDDMDPALARVMAMLSACTGDVVGRPRIVAIDGHSGSGKSTFAARLSSLAGGVVLEGDDFYRGGVDVPGDSAPSRAERCIDWRAQRSVLQAVRRGELAQWHAFDWTAFDGRLCRDVRTLAPSHGLVILEGVYAARAELADLVDLSVLLRVSEACRRARLLARDGPEGPWDRQWREAEAWYFVEGLADSGVDLALDL